jgi:MFS family permease
MLFAFGNTTQSTLLDKLVGHYSIGSSQQSYISSVISAGMFLALCLLLSGAIRFRRPLVLITAVILAALFFFALSFIPSFYLLLVFYFFIGMSYGLIDTSASSVTADLYAGQDAARHMGLLHSFFGIGGVCGPLLIQQMLLHNFAWNIIIRVFAAAGFGVFIFSVIVYLRTKKELDTIIGPTPKTSLSGLKTFLTRRNTLLMIAVGFKGAQEVCLAFWLARYITVGLDSNMLGPIAISLMWLGSSVSRIVIPMLPFNINKYIIYSMLCSAAVLIIALTFSSALLMCAASLAVGLTSGAVVPMGLSSLCARCPENTLLASTSTLLCIYAGQALLPFTAGLLFGGLLLQA